ncbi:MAG: hypothetical protein JXR95_01900 [Deltaproteobacteria bacterium]|nr:hypothetical protein [Deltaproteobacteria bacterium]
MTKLIIKIVFLFSLVIIIGCDDNTENSNNVNDASIDADSSDSDGGEVITNPYCDEIDEPTRPFNNLAGDNTLYSIAADFTVETTEGSITLSEIWTGCDSILFIPDNPSQNSSFPDMTWADDVDALLQNIPENVHLFFVSDDADSEIRNEKLSALSQQFDDFYETISQTKSDHWKSRVHFVTGRARELDGYASHHFPSPGFGFGIDRFQRIRYIGSFADPFRYDSNVGWFAPNLSLVRNETIYYNFESDREQALKNLAPENITLIEEVAVSGDHFFEVELPSSEEMEIYDTLLLDMTNSCDGGEVGYCPEWDRLVYLYLCADETDESCNLEIGRWITSYHRHGRWVHDISPLLGLFRDGGTFRFKYYSQDPWKVSLNMLLASTGKPYHHTIAFPLWHGYNEFNETYNENFPDITVTVPTGYTKMELATSITGHGMSQPGNCAEFCNTEHYFEINSNEYMRDFPQVSQTIGCMWQTEDGTVPNQYGTWWYGRSGWCPGKEVPLVTYDITEQTAAASQILISYGAFYNDEPYSGDNWRGISLSSWVIAYYEE